MLGDAKASKLAHTFNAHLAATSIEERIGGDWDDDEEEEEEVDGIDPRCVAQLSSVIVRNLSLNPLRDRALRSLAFAPQSDGSTSTTLAFPPAGGAADDADLALAEKLRHRERANETIRRSRRRSGSSLGPTSGSSAGITVRSEQHKGLSRTLSSSHRSSARGGVAPPALRRSASTLSGSNVTSYEERQSQDSWSTVGARQSRPRTTSAASWASGRSGRSVMSVRFEASPSSSSHPRSSGPSRAAAARGSIATWTAKALHDAMRDRMCECFVTMSLPGEDVPIYVSPPSQPGVHAAWGLAPPLEPSRDFREYARCRGKSVVLVSLWARKNAKVSLTPQRPASEINSKGKGREQQQNTSVNDSWQCLFERSVNLADLEEVGSSLAESHMRLPPNAILLGLSNMPPDDESQEAQSTAGPSRPRPRTQRSSATLRGAGQHITYYLIRPLSKEQDATDDEFGSNVHDTEEANLDAYVSDPEDLTQERRKRTVSETQRGDVTARDAAVKKARRQHQLALRRSLRETRMKKSYDAEGLQAILHLQSEFLQARQSLEALKSRLNKELKKPSQPFKLHLRRSQMEQQASDLRMEVTAEKEQVETKRRDLDSRREALSQRKARLAAARHGLAESEKRQMADKQQISTLEQQQKDLSNKIQARRVALLQDLEYIYPIELVSGTDLLFSILDLPLPNGSSAKEEAARHAAGQATASTSQDDDITSSALGLVAQLVTLLSAYLTTPLHYPIATAGSRAIVHDGISVMQGPRTFPLYAKGVEPYRFEYAVFLLNKDIEQLMNMHNITVLDVRHTLPNLKNLILTLSASEIRSHETRRKHVGTREISLASGPAIPNVSATANGDARKPTGDHQANSESESRRSAAASSASSSWTASLFAGWRTPVQASPPVVLEEPDPSAGTIAGKEIVQPPTTRRLGAAAKSSAR